jgi:hypothetical protein
MSTGEMMDWPIITAAAAGKESAAIAGGETRMM